MICVLYFQALIVGLVKDKRRVVFIGHVSSTCPYQASNSHASRYTILSLLPSIHLPK